MLRIPREEECATKKNIGVLCSGKRFRPNKKRIVVEREGKHSDIKERYIGVILHIKVILHTEENICHFSPLE